MAAPEQNASWYTVDEIAQHLKVSRSNVYQLVERGQLVAHRIGRGRGCIRIEREDLETFLAGARRSVAPDLPAGSRRAPGIKLEPSEFQHLDVSRVLDAIKPPRPR